MFQENEALVKFEKNELIVYFCPLAIQFRFEIVSMQRESMFCFQNRFPLVTKRTVHNYSPCCTNLLVIHASHLLYNLALLPIFPAPSKLRERFSFSRMELIWAYLRQ